MGNRETGGTTIERKGIFTLDRYAPRRFRSLEVKVGNVGIGGANPIRIQSMTTSDTCDTESTVKEIVSLVEAGCEIVRLTAPSLKDVENLREIKTRLKRLGISVPLVADIHFTPNAAEMAARIVEKVRINPGNYVDRKKFEVREYTDEEYQQALQRIYDRFSPLVKICKEYGTALRIGVNHGSLSDRIMNRYGDTPEGMVESAYEFIRVCEAHGFHQIVLSMKASNPLVMVEAYRLLVHRMLQEGTYYPLHLGVTEAGDGIEGRIKSGLGIATLLADGIGDTIRVSLAEPAENEIPVAEYLAQFYNQLPLAETNVPSGGPQPISFSRYRSAAVGPFGDLQIPMIILTVSEQTRLDTPSSTSEPILDFLYVDGDPFPILRHWKQPLLIPYSRWKQEPLARAYPYFSAPHDVKSVEKVPLFFVKMEPNQPASHLPPEAIAVFRFEVLEDVYRYRRWLDENPHFQNPIVLQLSPQLPQWDRLTTNHQLAIHLASLFAPIAMEGRIDGIWLDLPQYPLSWQKEIALYLLQGMRLRLFRTEYIACPSCGRTLFNLQETTAKIQAKTAHLKGLKIAVMGCIVNGPGEMADADYGYVGSGPGRVTLYRGKTVVKKNIPEANALEELIALIKADGKWQEPPQPITESVSDHEGKA